MRIVDFGELEELWRDDERDARWQDDFDGLFASWEVNLDDLFPTPHLDDLDFGYIDLHDMVK